MQFLNSSDADEDKWKIECEIYEPYTVKEGGNEEPLWFTIANTKKSGLQEP